jgi:predicted nucleic acid-binding protein
VGEHKSSPDRADATARISTRLDFGDAMIVASMEHHAAGVVYSYDADFDGLPGISRRKPG